MRTPPSGVGIHRFVDPENDEVFLYSQFATMYACHAFACFDQPDIKGTFQFTVTAPAHWVVVSNTTAPIPHAPVPHGPLTWAFEPTVALPTYATAVCAGPYAFVEGSLQSVKGEIPARVYGRPQLIEHFAADQVLSDSQAGFELYERIFDTEFPYDSYDHVYVPQFNFGAMENAGCVTMSEDRLLFRTRPSDAELEFCTIVVLHELAHMWFGDLVTMRWWDDLWLNEAFAEYVGHLRRRVRHTVVRRLGHLRGRTQVRGLRDRPVAHHPPCAQRPSRRGFRCDRIRHDHVRQGRLGATPTRGNARGGRLLRWSLRVSQAPRLRQRLARRPLWRTGGSVGLSADGVAHRVARNAWRDHAACRRHGGRRWPHHRAHAHGDGAGTVAPASASPSQRGWLGTGRRRPHRGIFGRRGVGVGRRRCRRVGHAADPLIALAKRRGPYVCEGAPGSRVRGDCVLARRGDC